MQRAGDHWRLEFKLRHFYLNYIEFRGDLTPFCSTYSWLRKLLNLDGFPKPWSKYLLKCDMGANFVYYYIYYFIGWNNFLLYGNCTFFFSFFQFLPGLSLSFVESFSRLSIFWVLEIYQLKREIDCFGRIQFVFLNLIFNRVLASLKFCCYYVRHNCDLLLYADFYRYFNGVEKEKRNRKEWISS